MTIYRLYNQNGNRAGFWVQHRRWSNLCAQVFSIGGQQSGALPGRAPLHGNAKVVLRCFDVRSGRPVSTEPSFEDPEDRHFAAIAEPYWYHPRMSHLHP